MNKTVSFPINFTDEHIDESIVQTHNSTGSTSKKNLNKSPIFQEDAVGEEKESYIAKSFPILPLPLKTYECPSENCSFSVFDDLPAFSKHLKVHRGEKLVFSCTYSGCDKRFQTNGHLMEHIRTHTGDRPYVCPICDKRFMRANTLNVHFRKHSSNKPFICNVEGCTKRYTEKGNLSKHMKVAHS